MRTVVSSDQVAHFFSNQLQPHARNSSGSFYFEGDSIYSYGHHFCIARFYKGKLLMTKRTYGNTTARHVSKVWSACRQHEFIICYHPEHEEYSGSNFASWRQDIANQMRLLAAARKPERYLNEIQRLITEVKAYAEHMGFEIPEDLRKMIDSSDIEQLLKNKAEDIKKLIEHERKQERERLAQQVKDFKEFRSSRIYNRKANIDYLRVSHDGGFETSQGISLTIEEGMRLYSAIKLGQVKRGDQVSHYYIKSIDEKMLVVGCHNMPMKEIESVVQSNIEWLRSYMTNKSQNLTVSLKTL